MAHEITDTDNMFSVRQVPWHGLGTVMSDYPTLEEARQIAHPWEPIGEPIFRRVPVVTTTGELTEAYEEVPESQAIVRSDNSEVLGVVGSGWAPVSNKSMYEIADALEGTANSDGGAPVRIETAGSLRGGRKVWLLVRLEEPIKIKGDPTGETIPYFAIQNANDGTAAFKGSATMTRIVCHAVGTPVLYKGEWINVEDHPGVMTTKDEYGLRVHIEGLPDKSSEVVTIDHKYWAKLPGEDPEWVEAGVLTKKHMIGYPIPDNTNRDIVPDMFKDDLDDFWWAVGLFWGDGNLVGNKQVCWSVSDSALESRLMSFIKRHGFRGRGSQKVGVKQITWSCQSLYDFVSTLYRGQGYGKGGRDKFPIREWEEIPLPDLTSLVSGYYDADGSEDKNRGGRIWASTQYEGLLSLRRMLMRLGHPSLIRLGHRGMWTNKIDGRTVYGKESYSLRSPAGKSKIIIEDGWVWSPVKLVEWAGVNTFVPLDIPEDDHVYTTHFGRSHNCANTLKMSELESKARGTNFTFRHTTTIDQRIEMAKNSIALWREGITHYQEVAEILAKSKITKDQREEFIERFHPLPSGLMVTDRVQRNVMDARDTMRELFAGPTLEYVADTAHGLVQSAVEYLQHYKKTKGKSDRERTENLFARSMLDQNALVETAVKMAREIAHV